jgi:hypothetical protein
MKEGRVGRGGGGSGHVAHREEEGSERGRRAVGWQLRHAAVGCGR